MSDHKFTGEEIVKALRELQEMSEFTPPICHYEKDITEPPFCKPFEQFQNDVKVALALINRQKAEIERLNTVHADMTESLRLASEANKDMSVGLDAMRGAANFYKMHYETARTEAIKEFAKKIKTDAERICDDNYIEGDLIKYVDTLVKEMTEEKK